MLFYQSQNWWLRSLIAIICGLAGTLSFSPFDIWLAAIFSLLGLQLLIVNCSSKQAILIAFCWGGSLFASGVNWVYGSIANFSCTPLVINVFVIILLVTYLSIYPVLFAYLLNQFFKQLNIARFVFATPALWQITEYLRGRLLTGFPWLQFGYSQINGPLKSIAPIFGVEMISLLLVMISSFMVFALVKRKLIMFFKAICLLFLPLLFSKFNWITPIVEKTTKIALVQGNIPQSLKWKPEFLINTISTYLNLSKSYFGKVNIIIWPESAIPSIESDNISWLLELDKLLNSKETSLITGIIDTEINKNKGTNEFFNSIIVLGLGANKPYCYPNHKINRYRKHHLVPFGEFIPLKNIIMPMASKLFNIPISHSNFSRGSYQQKQLKIKNIYFTAVICYEIILGSQVRDNFNKDTNFLLSISNDAWFGNSIGPWQHLQMARMRALELGRPLLFATNNGVTAVISYNGNIQAILPQFIRSVLNTEVIPTSGLTPYAMWSNWPMWVVVCLFIILSFIFRRNEY